LKVLDLIIISLFLRSESGEPMQVSALVQLQTH